MRKINISRALLPVFMVRFLAWFEKSNAALEPTTTPSLGVIPKEIIARFLSDSPVVVEAGAHEGLDTAEMSKRWPGGMVHAFEPVPILFEHLTWNTRHLNNVRRYKLALSDKTGTAKMFVSSGTSNGSSSLLAPKEHFTEHPSVLFDSAIKVSTMTLDEWAEVHHIHCVDFMWLDMQGSELSALQSSPKILKTVRAIYLEVMLKEEYEGAPLYPRVREWLESQGFQVQIEEIPWEDAGNVLFVRK